MWERAEEGGGERVAVRLQSEGWPAGKGRSGTALDLLALLGWCCVEGKLEAIIWAGKVRFSLGKQLIGGDPRQTSPH